MEKLLWRESSEGKSFRLGLSIGFLEICQVEKKTSNSSQTYSTHQIFGIGGAHSIITPLEDIIYDLLPSPISARSEINNFLLLLTKIAIVN